MTKCKKCGNNKEDCIRCKFPETRKERNKGTFIAITVRALVSMDRRTYKIIKGISINYPEFVEYSPVRKEYIFYDKAATQVKAAMRRR